MQTEDSSFHQHESKQMQNPTSQVSGQSIDALFSSGDRNKVFPGLLKNPQEASQWCFWHWNLQTDRVESDINWLEYLDMKSPCSQTRQEFLEQLIHIDDLPSVRSAWDKCLSGETSSCEIVYRLKTTNNQSFAIIERGKVTDWDSHHQPLQVTGCQELVGMGWSSDRSNVSNFASELLNRIRQQIATHGRFDSTFRSICEDVCSFLGAERVLIYQLFTDNKNIVASMANASPFMPEYQYLDSFPLNDEEIKSYTQGEVKIIANGGGSKNSSPVLKYLQSLQVEACTVVPILEHHLQEPELVPQPRLWGLLVAHHHRYPFPSVLPAVPSISQQPQSTQSNLKGLHPPIPANFQQYLELNSELLTTLKQVGYLLEIAVQKKNLAQHRSNAIATLAKTEVRVQELQTHLEQTQTELAKYQQKLIDTDKFAVLGHIIQDVVSEISKPIDFIYTTLKSSSQYAEDVIRLLEFHQNCRNIPRGLVGNHTPQVDADFLKTELLKSLWSMRAGSDRVQAILVALHQFTPAQPNQVLEYDLHAGINSCLRILDYRLKANSHRPGIQVIKDFAQIPEVECYPSEINQVLLHLLHNAIDAIEERFQGNYSLAPTIRIRTAVTRSHLSVISHSLSPREDEKVCQTRQYFKHKIAIAITDNGIGILPHIQRQIFKPFFTTKSNPQVTGLGLTTSKYIIENIHHGRIRCNSQFGQGTEVVVELNPTIR